MLFLVATSSIWAQTTANVTGTVRDVTGAVLSGAQVTARNVETNLTRTTKSGADGRYLIPVLPAGRYEIRGELERFRPLLQRDILLEVAGTRSVDLNMELGAVDQEVTVVGQVANVNTNTSELSYLVSSESIENLPLNGRNYTDLALLQPGVIAYPHRDGGSVVAHGLGMSVNGQDPRSNVFLLDGTPQNDFTNGPAGSAAGTALGMETIREFKVETNAYSAEFGRSSGGQINALTKSGTNSFHGSLFEYHRNDNFDARNFFDPSRVPEFKRNQYGATLGGPIAQNKTFFFVGWEGLRERLGRTLNTEVPDLSARQGVIGSTTYAIDPLVRPYLNEYPLPNGPARGNGFAIYTFGFNQELNQDFVQGRVDHNFNESNQVFARYTYDGAEQRLPTDYPQFPRAFVSKNQFATTEWRQTLSPETLNFFRLGFSRTRIAQTVESNTTQQLTPFVPGRTMIGNIDLAGLPRFGPQTSVDVRLVQNVYGFEQGLTLQRGRQLIKTGMLVERYQDNMVNPTFGLGVYTFTDLPSFLQNRPARFIGLTPNGALDRYWRFTLFGFYVQDDIKVTPRLTINAGLRYEFATLPVDIYGRDSALPNPYTDTEATVGELYQNPTRKNFSPRVGFAWDVFGDGKLSVRSAYGLFFNTNNHQNLIVTVTNPPATPRPVITNPTFPQPSFDRAQPISIRPIEWNLKNPYVQMYNFNVQRSLWFDTVLTVGYSGSRGVHLLRSRDINIAEPERLPDGTLFWRAGAPRRNPAFSTIELKSSDGNSWYNALLVELNRRWKNGLSLQSSYTFSRNIDTTQASTFFSDATNGTTSAMPEFEGFNYNKGLSDYHAKHMWVVNGIYELPFGKSLSGFSRAAIAGWQLAGILTMRSGNPLTA
ncbi:MAG TPA: TonB-dependent receptor, partial [Bryobacteraceae bacterium]|nr:TonB-dependent receptor [Bryobacteraceae bacterium]